MSYAKCLILLDFLNADIITDRHICRIDFQKLSDILTDIWIVRRPVLENLTAAQDATFRIINKNLVHHLS